MSDRTTTTCRFRTTGDEQIAMLGNPFAGRELLEQRFVEAGAS